jgi:hypothetical protein
MRFPQMFNESATRSAGNRISDFTFPRRNFLQGLASVVLPSLISQPASSAFGHSLPKFNIGDGVRTSWEADGVSRSETGQVVGICWHPTHKHWEYMVVWGSSQFDEGLTDAKGLEFNHHA